MQPDEGKKHMKHYDAILIGTGQAAPALAAALAGEGQRVALLEGARLGGSCVNFGCTPTKTLRASARAAANARHAAEYGIQTGEVRVDFAAVMARKNRVVDESRGGLEGWLESLESLDLIRAFGYFVGREGANFIVQAGNEQISAPRVFLNTGTRAFVPPVPGLEALPYLDNKSLMELRELPRHLLILGGGYIGVETGQIFRRLGSQVTIIEQAAHVAAREDADIIAGIEELLREEGITLRTGHKALRFAQDASGQIVAQLEGPQGALTITGSHLLVAVGRVPNTEQLNLGAVGVETDARGYIPTNERLETNVPGIWALGDINKRGAFTHTSYHDHEIVLANLRGGQRSAEARTMAYAMYTDPPLGRVGMSEREARQSGRRVLRTVLPMSRVSRAKEDGETRGLIKVLVDAESEQFLGAAFFGQNGDEIVQVISNYMATGASYRRMQEALPIHPTITEFMPTILGMLEPLEES